MRNAVVAVLLLGSCASSLSGGARNYFSATWACPVDRVSVVADPAYRPPPPPPAPPVPPPPAIAADPDRLAIWNQQQAAAEKLRVANLKPSCGGVYQVSGCGEQHLLCCYHPTDRRGFELSAYADCNEIIADEPPLPALDSGSAAVPDVVARAQKPGTVTILEFVDFECPFCRRLASELATAVGRAPGSVTVIRKMVPLAMHPHARTAALAWACADAQGKGDAMADALFAAPPDTLTPEGCERLAEQVGCDLDRYRQALADPATAARVEADLADAKAAGATALPTIFIGTERFTGAGYSAADLLAAIEHAH